MAFATSRLRGEKGDCKLKSDSTANALFKQLLRDLRPLFRQNGFRSANQNFTLESAESWVIVNFQKSRWSEADEKTFYVNVSATAKRLLVFNGRTPSEAPPFYACEWRWRVEQFGPDENIKQWTIRDERSKGDVVAYLQTLFKNFAIPAVRELLTERGLLARYGGSNYYPHLKARSVLFAAEGKEEEARKAITQLIEQFGSGVVADGVREHLGKLRSNFPEIMRNIERSIVQCRQP